MSKTVRATTMGFCPGVRRALEMVEATRASGEPVHTLGPIVHNADVVRALESRGIGVAENASDVPTGTVVIRSHGATVPELNELESRPVRLVDATCPKVRRLHRIAERCSRENRCLAVIGDPNHAEVRGIVSRCPEAVVVSSAEEALATVLDATCIVIAQTTFGRDRFVTVCGALEERFPGIEVKDSICSETDARHEAVKSLSTRVDAIVVVGDKRSANTGRLYEEASRTGLPSWRVERAEDLPDEIAVYRTIGITAGASTSEETIVAVERTIHGLRPEVTP